MKSLISIRQHFGLTQANIAVYLSVSESQVKMVEAGKRELPSAALVKLAQLEEIAFDENNAVLSIAPTLSNTNSKRTVNRYVRQMERQIQKNEKLLSKMLQRYQQTQRRAVLAGCLLKKVPETAENTTERLWLQILEAEALASLEECNEPAQAILQWKIDNYIYSVEMAKALLAEWA